MGAAWAAAATVAAAYIGSQSQGKAKAGEPMFTARNMPPELLNRYKAAQAAMPVSGNVQFGDQTFPQFYGPNARMTQMLYQPAGSTAGRAGHPSPYGAAAQAALPYINAWANQPQTTNTTQANNPNYQYPGPYQYGR
ncbi:MAG: hypothetical protein ACXABY_36840 [Candidatus Thorarchaeota archaeon]|jgi:hypothetical protein